MTLCLAWKNGNKIGFASDSRLSVDDDHYCDIGIKIMEIPVKIKNPIPVETGIEEIIYDHKLGMCYCGDTINGLLIKETVAEVLQNLQLLPSYTEFSLKGICNLIIKFIENISNHLKKGLEWDADIEILIGGYCPNRNKEVVYRLQLFDYIDHYEVLCDEVLTEDKDMIVLGSGSDRAEEIIKSDKIEPGNKLFKVLRDVCKDDSVPSVGGYIQYGHFLNHDFKIMGIADYQIKPGDEFEYIYAFRGTVLYRDEFESTETNYHIATTFSMPFEDEINKYWKNKQY